MKKPLRDSQLEQLKNISIELAWFELEINENMANGYLDDVLKVTDEEGSYPIVPVLGKERLSLLVERVEAIGGDANVLVKEKNHVSYLIMGATDGTKSHSAAVKPWTGGNPLVSEFVKALKLMGGSVLIPGTDSMSVDMHEHDVAMEDVDLADYKVLTM